MVLTPAAGLPPAGRRSLGPPPGRGSPTPAPGGGSPRRAQATCPVVPPAEHVPGHHRGEPIVAVGAGEVPGEALRVEHYPGGDLLRANPAGGALAPAQRVA